MQSLLVYAVALFFALMGLVAIAQPQRILSPFGHGALGVDARNEVRAVYGGFGLGIAGLLCIAESVAPIRAGVLWTVIVALLGMAIGRLIAWVIDRQIGYFPTLFVAVEVALAAMLLAGL